ncbi:MAG: oligosaccharide flippase family protein [Anaerolineae bacterium]
MSDTSQELSSQAVQGGFYSTASSMVTMVLGFVRSVLLARLLLPAYFGVAALALFYLELVFRAVSLDLDSAVIHHQSTDDKVIGNFMALRISLGLLAAAVAVALSPLLAYLYPQVDQLGLVLRVFALITLVAVVSQVMEILLRKQLNFRRLAIIDISSALTMTVVAPILAWRGAGIWALVAELGSGVAMRILLSWGILRPWRPRWHLGRENTRWFIRYCLPLWWNGMVTYFLDRTNDFWVGTRLGDVPLGIYSKAAEYARYPRRIFGLPLVVVAQPVFARLQHDRLRLSQTFARVAGLMVRLSALFSVAALLAIPFFVKLVLGPNWLNMIVPFQLFLVFTLFDPLVLESEALLLALGSTRELSRIRLLQLAVFLPATIVLTIWLGVNGAVLALDLEVVVGLALLYFQVRKAVDFSLRALFGWPAAAVALAAAAGFATQWLWVRSGLLNHMGINSALAVNLASVTLGAALVYGLTLWLGERKRLKAMLGFLLSRLHP